MERIGSSGGGVLSLILLCAYRLRLAQKRVQRKAIGVWRKAHSDLSKATKCFILQRFYYKPKIRLALIVLRPAQKSLKLIA